MLKVKTTLGLLVWAGMLSLTELALATGFEDCTKEPKTQWKPQAAAEAAAKAAGYEVRKSKIAGTCYEVYAIDKHGSLLELFYSPVDLQLVKTVKKS